MAKKHLAAPLLHLMHPPDLSPSQVLACRWQGVAREVYLLTPMNDRAHGVWIESGNRLQAEWVITAAASVAPAARAAPFCKTLCPAFPPCQISPAHLLPAVARSLHFLPVSVPPPVLFFLSCPWAGNMALADQLPSQRTL